MQDAKLVEDQRPSWRLIPRQTILGFVSLESYGTSNKQARKGTSTEGRNTSQTPSQSPKDPPGPERGTPLRDQRPGSECSYGPAWGTRTRRRRETCSNALRAQPTFLPGAPDPVNSPVDFEKRERKGKKGRGRTVLLHGAERTGFGLSDAIGLFSF